MKSPEFALTTDLMTLRRISGVGTSALFRLAAPAHLDATVLNQMQSLSINTIIELADGNELIEKNDWSHTGFRHRRISLYCAGTALSTPLIEAYWMLVNGRGARIVASIRALSTATSGSVALLGPQDEKHTSLVVALVLAAVGLPQAEILNQEQDVNRAGALDEILSGLVESYGSIDGYLLSKGLTAVELFRLQTKFHERSASAGRELVAS